MRAVEATGTVPPVEFLCRVANIEHDDRRVRIQQASDDGGTDARCAAGDDDEIIAHG